MSNVCIRKYLFLKLKYPPFEVGDDAFGVLGWGCHEPAQCERQNCSFHYPAQG